MLTGVLLLSGCGSSSLSLGGANTPTPTAQLRSVGGLPSASAPTPSLSACDMPSQSPPMTTISASFPTALAFAPDGRLFYAERSGTVRVWQNGGSHVFARVSTVTSEKSGGYSERGLLGIAVSPTFGRDRFVYAFYSDADYTHQHVVRWSDCAGTGQNMQTLITIPAGPDCCHKGGRLAFGGDGDLYVTVGEEHTALAAQDTSDVRGKVLRYLPDGGVPRDNPFGSANPVWAYGFRNPFGIAISSAGQVAVTNNGPSGDAGAPSTGYDTAVLKVTKGGGYQWPYCYGYSHPLRQSSCGGQTAPDWSSEAQTVVPTGIAFVDASGPAGYAQHVVFCTFNDGMLVLSPGHPHATVTSGPSSCRLDVKQGPDHALYYSDSDHIYRMG